MNTLRRYAFFFWEANSLENQCYSTSSIIPSIIRNTSSWTFRLRSVEASTLEAESTYSRIAFGSLDLNSIPIRCISSSTERNTGLGMDGDHESLGIRPERRPYPDRVQFRYPGPYNRSSSKCPCCYDFYRYDFLRNANLHKIWKHDPIGDSFFQMSESTWDGSGFVQIVLPRRFFVA